MSPARPRPTILIIDDDPGVQRYVSHILERSGYAVQAVADGLAAVETAAASNPDLLILDLNLPELSGLAVCERVRSWYKGSILILSGNGEVRSIVQALDLGADDYLVKPFRSAELLARIRALLRRVQSTEPPATQIQAGDLSIDLARREVHHTDGPIRLTRTEFDILAYLAKNADRVLTSESILREVWGPYHGEYAQTLRVHIGHIRKKIEEAPATPKLIVTETGVGYRFRGSAPVAEAAGA